MLRIITGRSGSGKTDEMLSLMKNCENSIYIVPEQYSFAAEKKITQTFGMSGMGFPTVMSLRRLAYFLEEKLGVVKGEEITKPGRIMVLGDIVKKLSPSLSLYAGAAKRGEMVSQSEVIVTTFKQYSITREKIEKAIEKTDNALLKKKLVDCMTICEAYDAFLNEGYSDADDLLEGLRKNIEKTDFLSGKDVFIDSFQAFTPLEYSVIEAMLLKCRSVTVSLCAYDGSDEFITAKKTCDALINTAKRIGVPYGGEVKMEGAMYTAADELKVLESSFLEDVVFENETDRVHIHCAKNEYTEAVSAALEIEKLCRKWGYRYRDIVIVARDMAVYEKELSRVFDAFEIPIFMDKKTPLASEAAAIFMLNAIKMVSRGWKSEVVFSYMKSPFSPLSFAQADELENYCLAAGVKSSDWKKDEVWTMPVSVKSEDVPEDYIERINNSRDRLTRPIMELSEKIKGKHTGREMAIAFYEFLEQCGIEERIEKIAETLINKGEGDAAMRIRQVYELMIEVLESFAAAFSEKKVTSEEFLSMLSLGIESIEIGIIPSTTDSVCAGSIDRAKGHVAKAIIVLGANEGKFPAAPKDTGIFTNADRNELLEYGIELPPDTVGKAFMEESLVYSALTCATERLYVSFCLSGEESGPSSIVKRLRHVFPKCVETSEFETNEIDRIASAKGTYEDFVVELSKMKRGEKLSDEWYTALQFYKNNDEWKEKVDEIEKYTSYENRTEIIKRDLIKARYGDEISTSVSRLEQFVKCPFAYFASVTLGLEERKKLQMTAADSGTFLHEFVDMFGKSLAADGKTWRDADEGYIDRKTEEITMELIEGLNKHMIETSPRIRNLFTQLKRIAKKSVTVLCNHMKKGTFEPLGYEIVFDKNGDFKPLTIMLPGGEKVNLRGRVDRADVLDTQRGRFVRIIDYKSGEKKFSMANIYHGFDLQLAVYLTAVCENGDYNPAGMLYFRIDDPVIEGAPDWDEALIEKLAEGEMKMDGLVLKDDEVLSAMDASFENGSSVIPVRKKKDGDFTEASRVATEEEFKKISSHVKSTVKKLCKEILSGENSISPVRGACTWCEMKSVCKFDTSLPGCNYRWVEKINDKDALLKIISEEQNEKTVRE